MSDEGDIQALSDEGEDREVIGDGQEKIEPVEPALEPDQAGVAGRKEEGDGRSAEARLEDDQPEPESQTITVRIPRVTKSVSVAVLELLQNEHMMTRPPVYAAPLLALIVYLHKTNSPFPDRADVAEYLGCSISTVDAALSTRIDQGYISMRVETEHGSVEQRPNSSIRIRYYDPSEQLIEVVRQADRFRSRNWQPQIWEKERPVSRKHLGYQLKREERRKKRLETMQGKLDDQAIRLTYLERELAKRGLIKPSKLPRKGSKNTRNALDPSAEQPENNHSQ